MKTALKIKAFLILFTVLIFPAHSYSSEEIMEFSIASPGDIVSSELVQTDPENGGALLVDSKGNTVVELFDLYDRDLGEKRLTYSARLKSEALQATEDTRGIAFLEIRATFPDGEELIARGPRVPVMGTSDWKAANTVLYVDKGENPDTVILSLVVEGEGKVWIEDVKLFHRPLRTDYLFWGHVVVWIVLIIYIYHLIRKQKRLKQELKAIEAGA